MGRRKKATKLTSDLGNALLEKVSGFERNKPLETLHLSPRAIRALAAKHIYTITRLAERVSTGLDVSGKNLSEIEEALCALSRSVQSNGGVDWLKYASSRGFLVLPEQDDGELSPRQFLRIFPKMVRAAVESSFGPPEIFIVEQYLIRSEPMPLHEIGRRLGFTRQAAALIKEKVLKILREAILNDRYSGCRFRFRDTFVARLRQLGEYLRAARGNAQPFVKWEQMVVQVLGVGWTEVGRVGDLIMAILDYHVVHPSGRRFQPIVIPKSRSTGPFTSALTKTESLLRRKFPGGLSKAQLLEELRLAKSKIAAIPRELPTLINSIHGVEPVTPTGRFRVRLDRVSRLTDQLERLLRERGSAMHRRELASIVGRFKGKAGSIISATHIGTALYRDDRFKPIGRTGLWVLSEWKHIETGTIADVAAEFLLSAKKPLTESELYKLISQRRPLRPRSIYSLLGDDGRFRHVSPGAWELR